MSELVTNKISPVTGTNVTLGDSGDTFTIASGASISGDGSNLTGIITKSSSDPTASTNPAGGVGTVYLNTTSGQMYSCTDASSGANHWTNIGDGAGAEGSTTYMTAANTNGTETTDGSFKVVTFNTSGTFTPTIGSVGIGASVDYLVVAGGGGGGGCGPANAATGGGGAGGLLSATGLAVSTQAYTITVGAGGTGGTAVNDVFTATSGSDSLGVSITATGGGSAPNSNNASNTAPRNGGSGAGGTGSGASATGYPGTGVAGQGNAGGTSQFSANYPGGGGGGAGAVGVNASTTVAGNGGVGSSNSTSGSAVTYAGGGGGGIYATTSFSSGGSGGGGAGGGNGATAGTAGTANLGGGGGGTGGRGGGGAAQTGGAGGSGIVIIRYQFQA